MIQTIELHISFQLYQKYLFESIYSNTSQSTKHNLPNNLFQHTLGVLATGLHM